MKLFHEIQKNGYSVRKVEEMARDINEGNSVKQTSQKAQNATVLPKGLQDLQKQLTNSIGTKVKAKYNNGKGNITIPFGSPEEMDAIIAQLQKLI